MADPDDEILFDLLDGNLGSLAARLRSGEHLGEELRAELAGLIELGQLVLVPDREDARRARQAVLEERDRAVGAWVWVRHLHTNARQLKVIKKKAAAEFLVSEGTVHRCYLDFSRRMRNADEFDWVMGMAAFHRALREWCDEQGLDYFEQHQRLYSVKNLGLKL